MAAILWFDIFDIHYIKEGSQNQKARKFGLQVIRKTFGAVLFDSSLGGLTMADQFLQVREMRRTNCSMIR